MTPTVSQSNGPALSVSGQKRRDPLHKDGPFILELDNTVDTRLKTATYGRLAQSVLQFLSELHLCPGDRIPSEKKLAIILGVSRPSIRCALAALEAMGHIQTWVGIGSFLIDHSASLCSGPYQDSSPLLILRACLTIEPELAGEAARICTDEMLTRMQSQWDELRLSCNERPVGISTHSDNIRFHELLAAAGGRQIVIIIGELWRTFYAEPNLTAFKCLSAAECHREMLSSYEALIDAIGRRDRWLSMRVMRRHLLSIQEMIRYSPRRY